MRVSLEVVPILKPLTLLFAGAAALAFLCLPVRSFAQQGQLHGGNGIALPPPPVAAVKPVTDDYFGTKVVDDYRWLEDAKSPQTIAWIKQENAHTQKYLAQVTLLPQIRKGLTALERVDDYSMPVLYGGKYFFEKRLADQNQASIYMRDGWNGKDQLLIDANKLSADQNTSIHLWGVAYDGSMLLYAEQQGGADQVTIHFYNVKDRAVLADALPYGRYFGASLGPKNEGIYYARFTHEGTDVWFHRFGTAVTADRKIFGGDFRGHKLGEMALVTDYVTDNQHSLVINISYGVPSRRDDILVKDLRKPGSPIVPLVYGVKAHNSVLDCGDRFFVQTDYKAPHGRIVEVKPGEKPADWKTVVPEGADVISSDSIVGGKLFVSRLHNVKTETTIYSLNGKQIGTLHYPGIGSGSVVYGRPSGTVGFYSYESFITPPSIYRYHTKTGRTETFFTPKIPFDSSQYEVKQVWCTSKDGTRVPMFVAGRKGLKRNGKARLLMTGYGGFDLPMLSTWNPEYAWWMQQGGFFALPNLRGGDEFGEAWHKAAMFGNKQNVFDDFFAAAEYLIRNRYTAAERFAIRGRSNGGLLMGAAMTQRPDLFGAIWCGYPLLDMLRYQYFEFGRLWTTEYGSSQNPKDFPYLLKYSPYQNVHKGTKYPAIMFFTGSSDTRVDPMNARKMTALMQASTGSGRPILLHYSLKGGHSSGVSLAQLVEDQADELGFLWTETSWL